MKKCDHCGKNHKRIVKYKKPITGEPVSRLSRFCSEKCSKEDTLKIMKQLNSGKGLLS